MNDKRKNVFLVPAMNTAMWQHPITKEQIERLQKFEYNIIPPIEKKLACGDLGKQLYVKIFKIFLGIGAMAHVEDIVETLLSSKQ